jgi:hypothetical protein
MPNWCDNNVTIRHDDQNKLKELHDAMLAGNFFKTVIPIPEELKNPLASSYGGKDGELKNNYRKKMLKKHGFESWYDFCIEKWGTKWDVEINSPNLTKDKLFASFSSAWAPPIGIYKELTRQGFDVDAKYCEFGVGFAGTYTSEDGEHDYNFFDDIDHESMPEELDEEFGIIEYLREMEKEAEG